MQKKSRPLGVIIVANLSIILGIIGLAAVVAVAVSGVNTPSAATSRTHTAAGSGALGLEDALYILVIGYGLRKRKGWHGPCL